jgi:hypothetical protein
LKWNCACRRHQRCQPEGAETSVRFRFMGSFQTSQSSFFVCTWGVKWKAQCPESDLTAAGTGRRNCARCAQQHRIALLNRLQIHRMRCDSAIVACRPRRRFPLDERSIMQQAHENPFKLHQGVMR